MNQELQALHSLAGHLIRRCKQKSTYYFSEVAGKLGLTPVQYAVLAVLHARSGLDQGQIAEQSALDASTASEVVERLEARGFCSTARNGRRRVVELTPEGTRLLEQLKPLVEDIQRETLAPLTPREQAQLLRLMSKLVGADNAHYQPRRRRPRQPW